MTALRLAGVALIAVAALAGALAVFAPWQGGEAPTLRFSSGTEGGTYGAFAAAMSEVFGDADGPAIEVVRSAGANENAARLARGEADLALIQSDTALGSEAAVVARMFPEAFHLVVREGAGIASVSDLRGKRVGTMPEGSGSEVLFRLLLAHYEIPTGSLTLVPGDLAGHAGAIEAGALDAFFMVVALGNETVEAIIDTTPTQLISIDQADAIAMFDPAFRASVVPVGTYSGERPVPSEPIQVVTVDSLLAARRSLPDTVVRDLTRALFEQRQALVRRLPQAAFVSAPTDQERLTFGVHPGADLYYQQDNPPFVVEYAEPIALGVTALALLISGLWQARIFLAGARKNRADHYNLEIVEILNRVEAASTASEFATIRRDLHAIFEKVIVDLDNDRIEEKSLLSFSFAWQVAASSLNHRQLITRDGAERPAAPRAPVLSGERAL